MSCRSYLTCESLYAVQNAHTHSSISMEWVLVVVRIRQRLWFLSRSNMNCRSVSVVLPLVPHIHHQVEWRAHGCTEAQHCHWVSTAVHICRKQQRSIVSYVQRTTVTVWSMIGNSGKIQCVSFTQSWQCVYSGIQSTLLSKNRPFFFSGFIVDHIMDFVLSRFWRQKCKALGPCFWLNMNVEGSVQWMIHSLFHTHTHTAPSVRKDGISPLTPIFLFLRSLSLSLCFSPIQSLCLSCQCNSKYIPHFPPCYSCLLP